MKKTLLGVLAFILVLATVLTGTVLAADDTASDTTNLGTVKMVDADHPIKVDGKMDEAYTSAIPLPITFRSAKVADLYTHGYARFVWSKAENALYCLVIMNDAEVNLMLNTNAPWNSDSVEMFVDFSGNGTQKWGIDGLTGDGALQRGLQYRIDGFKGMASCYLVEEGSTYLYDEDLGRMVNKGDNLLINAQKNIFGWNYSSDKTKTGWGYSLTQYGYVVEFRIDPKDQGVTLKDGLTFGFDFQVNDRYGVDANGNGTQTNLYYASTYREKTGEYSAGSVASYYDSLTLSEETVSNTYDVSEVKLQDYGMADATIEPVTSAKETQRTYTSRLVVTRTFTARKASSAATSKPNGTGNNQGDNNNNQQGGGCGSSIAVGTSVAMLAMVGAAGFFSFRRKDDEE